MGWIHGGQLRTAVGVEEVADHGDAVPHGDESLVQCRSLGPCWNSPLLCVQEDKPETQMVWEGSYRFQVDQDRQLLPIIVTARHRCDAAAIRRP